MSKEHRTILSRVLVVHRQFDVREISQLIFLKKRSIKHLLDTSAGLFACYSINLAIFLVSSSSLFKTGIVENNSIDFASTITSNSALMASLDVFLGVGFCCKAFVLSCIQKHISLGFWLYLSCEHVKQVFIIFFSDVYKKIIVSLTILI